MTTHQPDHDPGWVDRRLDDWAAAGLITGDQAEAIRRFERGGREVEERRLTVVAEVAVYLGSIIAAVGGTAIVGPAWSSLGTFGQLLVGVAIAAAGLVVGAWAWSIDEPGMRRLGGFLRAIGAAGCAVAATVVMDAIDPRDSAWSVLVVCGVVALVGAGLWRNLERPWQLLTTAVGVAGVIAATAELADLSIWLVSPVVWLIGLGVGLGAALGAIRPQLAALVVSTATMSIGSLTLIERSEWIGVIAALVSASLVLAYALTTRSWSLVGVGLFAFFVAVSMAMGTVLESTASQLVAVALGLVVVVVVALRAQRHSRATSGDSPHV